MNTPSLPPDHLSQAYQTAWEQFAIVPRRDRELLELTGEDRQLFLNNLSTNDIKSRDVGDACETFLTNVQGKIIAHGYVYFLPDRLLLDLPAGCADAVLTHLDRYLIREAVVLRNVSSDWQHALVVGPQAASWLAGQGVSPPSTVGHWQCANSIPDVWSLPVDAPDAVCCVNMDWLSVPSTLLLCPTTHAVDWATTTGPIVAPEVVDVLRVEQGTPVFGIDIDDTNLPQEVGRDEQAISFTKGCYLGQETVARIDALGHVNRLLRGLRCSGDELPAPGTALFAGEREVGRVTSAVASPRLGPLALGYVRREHAQAGTKLSYAQGAARVCDLPFE